MDTGGSLIEVRTRIGDCNWCRSLAIPVAGYQFRLARDARSVVQYRDTLIIGLGLTQIQNTAGAQEIGFHGEIHCLISHRPRPVIQDQGRQAHRLAVLRLIPRHHGGRINCGTASRRLKHFVGLCTSAGQNTEIHNHQSNEDYSHYAQFIEVGFHLTSFPRASVSPFSATAWAECSLDASFSASPATSHTEIKGIILAKIANTRINAAKAAAVIDHSTQVGVYAPNANGIRGTCSVGTTITKRLIHIATLIKSAATNSRGIRLPFLVKIRKAGTTSPAT